ncbi:MAG TPA: heme-degrading domain-containing protein [Actinomycetes bacterium]
MSQPAPQEPDLEALLAQEAELTFRSFDNDDAWRLGTALVDAARSRGLAVTVDIVRSGQQLFHAALPGTSADNDAWVARKARVVQRYGHSSLYVGELARSRGTSFEESSRLDPDTYAAHGGSFPVTVDGVGVVGAVTVSGLPQLGDHALVVDVLRGFPRG